MQFAGFWVNDENELQDFIEVTHYDDGATDALWYTRPGWYGFHDASDVATGPYPTARGALIGVLYRVRD